jgi:pimeloyl-[acyl-carrier protein] methyl ester esterase
MSGATNDGTIVLIHGWGMHGGIWSELLPGLAGYARILTPDLPGHGASPQPPGGFGLDTCADLLAADIPPASTVLGWSLGAMVAIAIAARQPDKVRRLVLVSATPKFVAGDDWPCGLDRGVFASFARSLAGDYVRTLRNFLTLQIRGSDTPQPALRRLRDALFERGEPDEGALADGLAILGEADLRPLLANVTMPTQVIAGERDTLVPVEASRRLSDALPRSTFETIEGAAHAPFLSHREAFLAALTGHESVPAARASQ